MNGTTVEYLDHLGSDLTVVNAARCSLNRQKTELDEQDIRLMQYMARNQHWSPFAHPQLSLRVTTSFAISRQLEKHLAGLVMGTAAPVRNEISRRYVDSSPVFYRPGEWRGRAEHLKQGSAGAIDEQDRAWDLFNETLNQAQYAYERLLALDVCPEQARFVLPVCTLTTWIWTGSLFAFARVVSLRQHDHAQAEAREVADLIGGIAATHFPYAWDVLMQASLDSNPKD